MNGDPGFTQILTRHYGAQSQTVDQLESPGTTPTSQSPQLNPSGLLQHPRTGSMRMPHNTLTTWMESRGFVKPSTWNKVVIWNLASAWAFTSDAASGATRWAHRGIPNQNYGGFSTTILLSNPMKVPVVKYEYLCYLPSRGHFQPPTRR
jgi:hypothetical protein